MAGILVFLSHNEIMDRGTVKLRVSDDLSVLLHVSAIGFSRLYINGSQSLTWARNAKGYIL